MIGTLAASILSSHQAKNCRMPLYDHILDNQTHTVADYLRRNLRDTEAFRLVSAYFTIYGYELLADELDRLGEVRFLFGDPTSVDDLDPGEKAEKSFELTEGGLVPNHTLHQKFLAQRCARWIQSDSVHIKSIKRSNFLHGKMYLATVGHFWAVLPQPANDCGDDWLKDRDHRHGKPYTGPLRSAWVVVHTPQTTCVLVAEPLESQRTERLALGGALSRVSSEGPPSGTI